MRLRVADDITQLVGETPLLQLKKLVPPDSAEIYSNLLGLSSYRCLLAPSEYLALARGWERAVIPGPRCS